jgi:phenylalanyl-tRNA synthetase beta subunit
MKISYNWLKAYVPEIPEAEKLSDLFTYHVCEVESVEKLPDGDHLFDLGILPNRAHDLLSHHGVARELSGLLGIPFKDPTQMYKTPPSQATNLKIEIQSDDCRRYSARIIRNVKINPSPEWVVKHLESIGARSINNVVDATNIVMYDCGQPCHAFDLKKLAGEKIIVTNAKSGDELPVVGRDGIVAKLAETDLVITDGEKNLGLGGVKGGRDSGISDDTTEIILEVANFDPVAIRKTARRLGLLSDSAKRFENDLSPTLCDFGMFSLSALIFEMLPEAVFEDIVDIYPEPQKERIISFTTTEINKLLGIEIPTADVEKILDQYGYAYTKKDDEYILMVPPLRLDLVGAHDMAEEIGRVYGYDKVKPILPKINFTPKAPEQYEKISLVRSTLIAEGYREVMTYAFANTGDVEVLASASDKKFLRTNLTDGLRKSYELNKLNTPLLSGGEIGIFEIGTIFKNGAEEIHVGWNEKEKIREIALNEFGESFLQVLGSPLQNPQNEKAQPDHSENLPPNSWNAATFKMWSMYPFIVRDIAVWVPEGTEARVLSEIYKEFGTELLQREPKLVDTFAKNEKVSYAFRLIFQSYDRTLTDEEINLIMSKITEKISSSGFEVR